MFKPMTFLQKLASGLTAVYGVTSLAGGMIGYVAANSHTSLIAGSISGALLLGSAIFSIYKPSVGLLVGSAVALALVVRFTRATLDKQELSAVAATMLGGGLAVLAASGLALFRRS